MGAPRKYTEEERAAALAALTANGGNLAKTAREVGVPRKTLEAWRLEIKPPDSESAASPRHRQPKTVVSVDAYERAAGQLDEKLESIAHRLADLIPGKIDGASLQQCAVSLGIAIEKMRLLREQTTSNSGGSFRFEFEQLSKLPYDELLRIHRSTLGTTGGDRN